MEFGRFGLIRLERNATILCPIPLPTPSLYTSKLTHKSFSTLTHVFSAKIINFALKYIISAVMNMKRFSIMASIVGVLSVLTGCSMFQKMPEGKLVSLEYTRSAMRGNEYEVSLTTEANGDVVLRAMKENYGELIEKKLTEEEVAGFVSIIKEEKMYKYKEKYRPLLKVLDGYMWHFNARFEHGSIDSGGSNANPGGEGLNRIKAYAISIVNRKE